MAPYLWLIIAAAMAVIEIASASLITVWFVIGGLAAFVVDWAGGGIVAQTVVFLAVSLLCLALLRPLALKHRAQGAELETMPVGRNAVVTERIDNAALTGRVETPDHMTWAALSTDGTVLDVGCRVHVVDRRSIKLIVEPIEPAPDARPNEAGDARPGGTLTPHAQAADAPAGAPHAGAPAPDARPARASDVDAASGASAAPPDAPSRG